MRYPIGDVARSLGVTPAGLHYFEKQGVIAPVKGDAAYRTYSTEEFIRLVSYKKYRNMEMPLKEIAHQFSPNGDDYEHIESKLVRQVKAAEEASRQYAQLAEDIRWFQNQVDQGIKRMNQFDFAQMPECRVLSVGEDGCISDEKKEQLQVANWLEKLPAVRISVFETPEGRAYFGYSVRVARARQLNLIETAENYSLGGKTCVHTFVKVPREFYNAPEMAFESVRAYMAEHGFKQDGVAAGVVLCVHCHDDELDSMLEIYAPFS